MSASLTTATVLQGRFGDESPEAVLLKNESVTRLLRALPSLSPRQRVLVRGFYLELRISKSWASRLHTKALQELRVALEVE
jgi:DNA-directed RNA polymerase specialized sigma subunit